MKITIINPNTTKSITKDIYEAASSVAASDTEINAITATSGPASIESSKERIASSLAVIEEIEKAKATDAFIIGCFGDPGLDAAREVTDSPVIGIAQASMYTASMVAPKFSIITLIPRTIVPLEEMAEKYGMTNHLASIRSTQLPVLDFEENPKTGMDALIEQSKLAIEEDGAEAIILGCAGMADFTNRLQNVLEVPVIDGVVSAVKMAEGLTSLGLKTSKICTYDWPPEKEYI